MSQFSILGEFSSITRELQHPVDTLGAIKPAREMKDSIIKGLLSSLLGGRSASKLAKDKSRYIATDDTGAHLLIFKGESLDSKSHYGWSAIKDVSTSIDEQFVNINFAHGDEKISWQILRYQLVEPDGSYLTDTDAMKQVGDMTANMETRFKTHGGS